MSPAPRPPAALLLAVLLLALAPRVGPALSAFHWSPDAAEHLLIARSLAQGEGFVLPIRVRYHGRGPVVHEAYGERAPLFPWVLAPVVRAGDAGGWPSPALQLLGVALAAACAAFATALSYSLAHAVGLRGWRLGWAALLGGLAVAWFPGGVRASIHLWGEPLGLLLLLSAMSCLRRALEHEAASRSAWVLGLCAGAARFARPEAWVLVPIVLVLLLASGRRRSAFCAGLAMFALNLAGVAATGVLAPQLELLEVQRYEDLMQPVGAAAPTLLEMVQGVARNLRDQLAYALLPKNAFLTLPLALFAWRRPEARPFFVVAAGYLLATAGVWSTNDPSRFTIAWLALLAPVAAVEALRRLPRGRWALAVLLAAWVGVLGYAAGREGRKRIPSPPPRPEPRSEVPVLDDPWSYALWTGRPAVFSGRLPGRD